MPQDLPVILHNDKRGLLTLEDGKLDVLQLSRDGRPPKRLLTCPARNFLRARLGATQPGKPVRLDLHTLVGKGNNLRLSKMHVLVEPINLPEAEEWVEMVMEAAYIGSQPGRKVLLLVNPVGGKGKSRATVKNDVLPILEAAGCMVEVRETTHRYHAQEIVEKIDLIYDVIAPVSGDGLIYEVFNGLAARPDAKKALKTPIGPIPTGSANSLCINLFGPDDTFNIPLACLNVIKGQHMPKDLYSVYFLESHKRVWSFLATAMGLMVDLDIGTEHLRWMGDIRFTLGFIKGVAASRNHLCRIKMRVVAEDKVEMARAAREWAAEVKGKKVVGGDVDPVVNGMKKLQVNGGAGRTTEAEHGKSGDAEGTEETVHGTANGHSAENDVGALADSKPIVTDDTWTVIESGSKGSVSKQQREVKAASTGRSGGWIDGEGVMYAYLGSVPWIARDLMQWPVAMQNSGAFDIVIQSVVPRGTMLSAITGAAKGEQYWMECQHYYKIDAMVVENLDKKNQKIMSVDGEAFPYEDFQVEMHPGLGTILSLDGHFFISEFLQKNETRR